MRLLRSKGFYIALFFVLVPTQVLWVFDELDFAEKLGLEAVVVAVAAVVFAVQHSNKLKVVTDELHNVALSVPTRGIGLFPSYLSEVPGLISRAKESIEILCDTPAHGSFSNTAAFAEYWRMLRHLIVDGEVAIKCKFFDAPGRKQLHQAQVERDLGDWPAWTERNRENCEAFAQLAHDLKVQPPGDSKSGFPPKVWAKDPATYVESMMAVNATVLSSFIGDQAQVLEFDDPLHHGPSVYCWLRDGDQEAVFVIVPVHGIGVRDLAGFHTREPELIRALGTVFDRPGGKLKLS